MTPLELLQSLDIKPKRALSQNFLIDPNIIRKTVRMAAVTPLDTVLEIGPGPGALTQELLRAGARVFAIEKDPLLARHLERLQTADQRLTVYCADALAFPLASLPHPLKVVANPPYHIATPLLEMFFENGSLFSSLTLFLQKELALRLGAAPRTAAYSSLTLFTQFYATLKAQFPVSASCFHPRPRYDSTVVHLLLKPPQSADPAPFFTLVRRAFQQRRKMIRTSLKELLAQDEIEKALIASGASPLARPEELSLDQWNNFLIVNKSDPRTSSCASRSPF